METLMECHSKINQGSENQQHRTTRKATTQGHTDHFSTILVEAHFCRSSIAFAIGCQQCTHFHHVHCASHGCCRRFILWPWPSSMT